MQRSVFTRTALLTSTCTALFFVVACGDDTSGTGGSGGSGGGSTTTTSTTTTTTTTTTTSTSSGGGEGGGTGGAGGAGGVGGATGAGGMGGAGGMTGAGGAGGMMGAGGGGGAGGGMTAPSCMGTADACDTFITDLGCMAQEGCMVTGNCSGGGTCDMYADRTTCEANQCTWTAPCAPTSVFVCSTANNQAQCTNQGTASGCEWNTAMAACVFNPTKGCYGALSQAICTQTIGCAWNDANLNCVGTATACGTYTMQADCDDQSGCMWQ